MWLKTVATLPTAASPSAPPCSITKLSYWSALPGNSLNISSRRLRNFHTVVRATPVIRNRRSKHSSEWIKRHITDRYVQLAQECDYRSRSAFKLEQLDDEYLFLRKDKVILDLGCYPGGWCQVAAKRCLAGQGPSGPGTCLSKSSTARVVGVDIAQMDPIPFVQFVQGRVGEAATLHAVLKELGDRKADVVLSDMAPACTGIRHDDHFNSVELCLYAADLMEQVLCLGGSFVVKMFMGSETGNYKAYLKSRFDVVHSAKPRDETRYLKKFRSKGLSLRGKDIYNSNGKTLLFVNAQFFPRVAFS